MPDKGDQKMPQFGLIFPRSREVKAITCEDYKDAVAAAGLALGAIDFGTVAQWVAGDSLSIIVFEYGLFPSKGDPEGYFGLNEGLYNGNAVLFLANSEGETVDLSTAVINHLNEGCDALVWLGSASAAEAHIQSGKVRRPQTSINGHTTWQWKGGQN